jgi:1,4-dihydroxy-2-naphthoate octaprenyltransferase
MSTLGIWLQAARPAAQANIAVPLLFGQALAFARFGAFSWPIALALLGYGLALHLFIVFINDLADEAGDRANTTYNRFSGGSRVLPEGKLDRAALRSAAIISASAMVSVSLYLTFKLGRPFALVWPAVAALLTWAYASPPLRLVYRGYGELVQGLGVGVVLPLTAIYAQAGELAPELLPPLLPALILGVAGNMLTSLADHPADAAADKRTYAVRVGQFRARRHAIELTLVAALLANLVLPELSTLLDLALAVPAAALLYGGARLLGTADAEDHGECERFVGLVGGAGHVLLLTWSLALLIVGITASVA